MMAAAAAALCFSAAAADSPVGGPHMADLSVLLPPRMTKPVEHRLIGFDGCFTWYTHFRSSLALFFLIFIGRLVLACLFV
ncbi:hypothetical protein OsJ_30370 [Oryza sativa Japonica Group]|uniref:Uncharacterized protein n=1 Tax=Oryza sativa subsp. japonica TaxID=39947 RepID=B9G550_ORYSJ|nr:hypothetical protein OsJ_30370 [Oryza sativa Japonica Group]